MRRKNLRLALLLLITMVACNKHSNTSDSHHHDAHKGHSMSGGHKEHQHHNDEEGPEDEQGTLGAHVHGEVHLALAVDATNIAIELTAPAESLLGFEKAPQSETEKKAWQDFKEQWDSPTGNYFEFEPTLECIKLNSKANFESEGEHAEIRAEMTFQCKKAPSSTELAVQLGAKFPRIKQIEAEVLPDEKASYVKTFKIDPKSKAAIKLQL